MVSTQTRSLIERAGNHRPTKPIDPETKRLMERMVRELDRLDRLVVAAYPPQPAYDEPRTPLGV